MFHGAVENVPPIQGPEFVFLPLIEAESVRHKMRKCTCSIPLQPCHSAFYILLIEEFGRLLFDPVFPLVSEICIQHRFDACPGFISTLVPSIKFFPVCPFHPLIFLQNFYQCLNSSLSRQFCLCKRPFIFPHDRKLWIQFSQILHKICRPKGLPVRRYIGKEDVQPV